MEEANSGLELVIENIKLVENDVFRWKWIIIALHNSMQNIMVAALKNGNGLNSMTNSSAKEWLNAYERNQPFPQTKLANFLDLYKRIKKRRIMECYIGSKAFTATHSHTESVKFLNSVRNRFTHFELDVWSLKTDDLPCVCLHCLDVIRFLVFESGNITFYRESQNIELQNTISKSISMLHNLDSKIKNI